jgi:hypothetical protein
MPRTQHRHDIVVHVALQFAARVAARPDQALQRFERRHLAIFGDPGMQVRERTRVAGSRVSRERGRIAHRARHDRIIAMRRHVGVEVRVGIREEHVVHEADRRGGTFDVGDDRANAHS